VAAETIGVVDEFVCTAPDDLAAAAFWDVADDELLDNVWGNAEVGMLLTFVFAFNVWWEATFDMAADAVGGDFPRLDDRFE
jgi:hypothetical protein